MSEKNKPVDILVVDDTVENLKILTALLISKGYNPRPVNNGQLALRAVRAAAPDLVLLDIRMPDMDGFEVCRQLKANPATSSIPVIFISAQHDIQDKLEAFQVGGVDYITKPFQLEEVHIRVETQLKLQQFRRRDKQQIKSLGEEVEARKKAEKKIRKYQDHLEDLVIERTVELEKALEQERSIRAQLIHADRLISMGRLSASVAHEIKNPMQSILGCLGLAEEAVDEGRSADKYFIVARDAVDRVSGILNRMRDLNRQSDETKVSANVNQVLEKVSILMDKHLQESGVEILWQKDENLPKVWMTPNQINQVFLNLLINANDAMLHGGRIEIHTSRTGDPEGVKIDFTDQGVGIS
ncbi:MAG: response regulator, partial [Chloroflexota bacterium]